MSTTVVHVRPQDMRFVDRLDQMRSKAQRFPL